MRKYVDVWRQHHGAGSVNLITARGCPYKCTLVLARGVWLLASAAQSGARSPTKCAEIVARYEPEQLWYADDVFTISHPWLHSYAAELRARGLHLPFETITRADRLQSEAAAEALAQLGCYRIWIGSESGSQRILDAMQRDVSVAEVHRAVELAHRHGIQVGMFLMWGYEGEELEDIAATVELVRRTNPEDLPHHGLLSDQGHALLRARARARASAASLGGGFRPRLRDRWTPRPRLLPPGGRVAAQ